MIQYWIYVPALPGCRLAGSAASLLAPLKSQHQTSFVNEGAEECLSKQSLWQP
jgi:hypothetical protein